jgi:hypothetical protein
MLETNGGSEATAAPSGCIVVLEPGARWPEREFARMPHRDGVVVMRESVTEPTGRLSKRLTHQLARMAASGVLLKTVLVVCATASGIQQLDRDKLASCFQEHCVTAPDTTVLVVTSDDESLPSNTRALHSLSAMTTGS